jgi:hypothetical protein
MLAGRGKSEMALSFSGGTAKPDLESDPLHGFSREIELLFAESEAFCVAVKTGRTSIT